MPDEGYQASWHPNYYNISRVRCVSETSWTSVGENSGSSDSSSESGSLDPPSPLQGTNPSFTSNLNDRTFNQYSSYVSNDFPTNGHAVPWPANQIYSLGSQLSCTTTNQTLPFISPANQIPACMTESDSFNPNSEADSEQMDQQNTTGSPRTLLRPWLMEQVNNNSISGLQWMDKDCTLLRIPWKHGSRNGWSSDDCKLFESWAKQSGKLMVSARNARRWKANFRCALRSLTDVKEVREMSRKTGRDAYRVYKFLPPKQRRRSAENRLSMKESSPEKDQQITVAQHCRDRLSTSAPHNWSKPVKGAPQYNQGRGRTGEVAPSVERARRCRRNVDISVLQDSEIKSEFETDSKSRILEYCNDWVPAGNTHIKLEEFSSLNLSNCSPVDDCKMSVSSGSYDVQTIPTVSRLAPQTFNCRQLETPSHLNYPRQVQPFTGITPQGGENAPTFTVLEVKRETVKLELQPQQLKQQERQQQHQQQYQQQRPVFFDNYEDCTWNDETVLDFNFIDEALKLELEGLNWEDLMQQLDDKDLC